MRIFCDAIAGAIFIVSLVITSRYEYHFVFVFGWHLLQGSFCSVKMPLLYLIILWSIGFEMQFVEFRNYYTCFGYDCYWSHGISLLLQWLHYLYFLLEESIAFLFYSFINLWVSIPVCVCFDFVKSVVFRSVDFSFSFLAGSNGSSENSTKCSLCC